MGYSSTKVYRNLHSSQGRLPTPREDGPFFISNRHWVLKGIKGTLPILIYDFLFRTFCPSRFFAIIQQKFFSKIGEVSPYFPIFPLHDSSYFGQNEKFTCREPNQAAAKGTFNSKVAMGKNRTGFPVECETPCWMLLFDEIP